MCLICVLEDEVFQKVPRKTKKATKKFLLQSPVRWSWRERRRFLRAHGRLRRSHGLPPMRRLPDGRVPVMEVW